MRAGFTEIMRVDPMTATAWLHAAQMQRMQAILLPMQNVK